MRFAILSTCVLVLLAACDREVVEITVTPRDDGSFEREVRFVVESDGAEKAPPEERLEAPGGIYRRRVDQAGPAVTFRGTFREVPADLPDAGSENRGGLVVWSSPLGKAVAYRERFPGRDDYHRCVEEVAGVVGSLTEVAAVLAERELAGEEGVAELAAAIRGPVRRDLRDLLVYLVAVVATSGSDLRPETVRDGDEPSRRQSAALAVILQQLEERGYLEIADLPGIGARSEDALLDRVLRAMGRTGDDALREKILAKVRADDWDDRVEAATTSVLSKEEQERIQAWGERLGDAMFSIRPLVRLRLRVPVEPMETNGAWDGDAGEVRFETDLDGGRIGSPVAFAVWAEPDGAWQEAHLGRVALEGKDLFELATWEASLPDDERAAWREAAGELDPAGDLEAQVKGLRERWRQGAEAIAGALGFELDGD